MLLSLIGLVVVLAVLGYRYVFGEPPALELMVVSSHEAQIVRQGTGDQSALALGRLVGVGDVVSTGNGGAAALQYGNGAQLMMAEFTALKVLEANALGVHVELDQGVVTARIRAGAPPLNISNRGRFIGATDADFSVMVARGGGLSTGATRGELTVKGFGAHTSLSSGSALHTGKRGRAELRQISESLLLEVEWPNESATRMAAVDVHGVTDPYATVTVGEGVAAVRVRADRDGRFSAKVELAEGVNEIKLSVRDVMGRKKSQVQRLHRDSKAPTMKAAEVVWEP